MRLSPFDEQKERARRKERVFVMFRTIVVPLDGSKLATQALPVAAHIARVSDCSLSLVQVTISPFSAILPVYDYPLYLPQIEQEDHRRATAYLEQVAASPEWRGIRISTNTLDGDPAEAILETAHQRPSPLIVLSSHGDTGVKRWMLGSVATKIMHYSHDPVLLLRPDGSEPLLEPSRSLRLLVPLDGSLLSEEALAPAITLTKALSAPETGAIHLACVLPTQKVEKNEQLLEDAQRYLTGVQQHLRESESESDLVITTSVLIDVDVASALINLAETGKGMGQVAEEARCDGIALTTHGWGAVQRWMMGSISERIVNTTKLPLLIVRSQKHEK